jgi:dipeptidyl aminopeptidase/acylaminoacyl peptidase
MGSILNLHLTHPLMRILLLALLAAPLYAQSPVPAGAPYALTPPGVLAAQVSPDGQRVALAGPRYGALSVAPLQLDADRLTLGEAVRLTDARGSGYGFRWTGDGRIVARLSAPGDDRLVAFETDGEEVELAGGADFSAPPFVAGSSVAAASDGSARLVSGDQPVPALRDASLLLVTSQESRTVWSSPDGMPLLNLAVAPDGRVAFEVAGGSLWTMNPDGSDARELGPGEQPAWSPDGRWLAFVRTTDDGHEITGSDLWVVPAEGGRPQPLAVTPDRLELRPAWGPGASSLLHYELGRGGIDVLPLTIR